MKLALKILGALILIIVFLSAVSGVYEDWLWFSDLGYARLFWTPFFSKLLIQLINGTMLFIVIFGTLMSGRHAFQTFYNEKYRKRIRLVEEVNYPLNISPRRITITLLLVSAIVSIAISFVVGFTGWLDVLSFFNSSSFNYADPLFNKDLSFFVFKLPFLQTIYGAFFTPILVLTLFTALFYIITGVIRFYSIKIWKKDAIVINPKARRHLAILLTLLFGLKCFGYFINMFEIVYSQRGHVVGAGFSDVYAALPVFKVLIVVSFICMIFSVLAMFLKDSRYLTTPIPFLIIFSLFTSGGFPSLVQSMIVIPNELEKETPYIQSEIIMTRFAYGLDKIETLEYTGNDTVTAQELKDSVETLENIRLNDPRTMQQVYTQKQGIRNYYKFNDIDIDRYIVDGNYRQVMLSAREISLTDLDPKALTFINTRFKYTHGFGLTTSFANAVTSKGLPAFAVSNIPPQTDYPELTISEPRIYFGELTNDWVVVNTKFKEFDYPQGNDNAENSYAGKTGIPFTAFNKLMLSLHQATPRFYLSREVTSQSKLLLYRNIQERVEKLAPFLTYDDDPYMVIDNGSIKWIIDAYTTTSSIPYSVKYADSNYIRNSVKVVVDAYNGTVDFYAIDKDDPILQTYEKIFPEVFKDITEMPYSLRSHLRYPETMFTIQCQMLNTFHMTNAKVFYNKEDAWNVAKEIYGSQTQNVEPYYVIMRLPGEEKEEFVLMQPFTPASSQTNTRNNMVAWLAARMDGEQYGKLILYTLPKNIEIDGPFQIESRIDQDTEISKQFSLWNLKGSSVIRGNLLALPIGGNFLFVEPIYLQSTTSGSIPEMKRVVLVYEDKIVMTATLEEGLYTIFGWKTPQLSTMQETPADESDDPEATPDTGTATDLEGVLSQIKQIREMLDALENQLTTMTNEGITQDEELNPIETESTETVETEITGSETESE
ncbi:UPF0182 family protein [Dehalobacter sp. DCM]|uniref:UPF0182 family membrane protein n=1 Tax=Dehalobacter sp. DCM TaxID=2907827 RepID=UPI0030821856|nr:UPF0182 family protein [Dehalobacter sp. DCM]